VSAVRRHFTGNEDYEFWLRAANAGFGIVQNLQPLGYYRRRDDSVSSNDVRMLNGIMAVLESVSRLRGPSKPSAPRFRPRSTASATSSSKRSCGRRSRTTTPPPR
jgi:hypothetical protein